jgi:hypothetical protein
MPRAVAAVAASPHPRRSIASAASSIAATLAAVLAVALLFTGIASYPVVGNDEWWFTSRYDRGAIYGDWSDTVAFDQYMNNRDHPKFPPANVPLRMVAHAVAGIGAPLDRYLSATEFVIVGVLLGVVAYQLGAPLAAAILAVPLLVLIPTVFLVARTMRFEQDIFFLGCVALLLACLPGGGNSWRGSVRLAVSGLAAGMAATMHIFGVAFGGGIVAAWAIGWLARQSPQVTRRQLAWWLAAGLVPVIATLAYMTADLSNTLAYYHGNARFEAAHLTQRLQNLQSAYPPLMPGLPERLHITVNALRIAMKQYGNTPFLDGISSVLAAVWGISFLVVAAGIPVRCWWLMARAGRASRPTAMALLACLVGTLLSAALLALRPGADYAVYLHGLTGLSFYLLVVTYQPAPSSRYRLTNWWQGYAGQLIGRTGGWLVLLLMMGLGAAFLTMLVTDPSQHVGGTQQAEIRAMRLVSALAGLEPAATDRPPIYADTVSWAAGGARFVPLYEYLISEVTEPREQYDAVVFRYSWYQIFVGRIPTFTGEPIDLARRQARMARLLDGLSFSGALQRAFGPPQRPDTRLWFARTAPDAPAFSKIGPDGHLTAARGSLALDVTDTSPEYANGVTVPLLLPSGDYFGMATGSGPPSIRLSVVADGRIIADGVPSTSLPQEQVGAILWFSLAGTENDPTISIDTDGHPSTVRLRIWRTDWVPAERT